MNQILMTEDPNKKKKSKKPMSSGPVEINSIVRFFAVIMIIFGISFIGQGSYAIYKDAKGRNTKDMPTISIARVNDTIVVKSNSINKITNFKYNWDNSEETIIPIEDNYMEEIITLPNENRIIHFTIEDETERAIKYQKEIKVEGIDMTKPMLNLEEESNGNVKITATDETEIAYITYKINEEDEIRVDKSESEHNTMNYILQFERGENKLIVTAVDTSNNIETLEKTIIVSELPEVQVSQNGNVLAVNIKDNDGIKKVEINLNGVIYAQDDLNQKNIKLNLPLVEGTNIIKIKVTNINGLVAESVGEMNYAP